jgi:hypothetical protein
MTSRSDPPAETMRITYEAYGRCLWHKGCDKSPCGIMAEIRREELRTLLRCLHCGREGYVPVGFTSVCVPVESRALEER